MAWLLFFLLFVDFDILFPMFIGVLTGGGVFRCVAGTDKSWGMGWGFVSFDVCNAFNIYDVHLFIVLLSV